MMILNLHRQGMSVAAIARETGKDAKTIRRYIAHGLEPPVYGPRPPQACRLDPYKAYLQERIAAYPQLSGRRLLREIRALGYDGGYMYRFRLDRTVVRFGCVSPSF
jgi:transposase